MAYYLSEIYPQLDASERRRIQHRLGCILNSHASPLRLREMIQSAFRRLPPLSEVFSALQLEPMLVRFVASFGILDPDSVSEAERNLLSRIPGVSFLDGQTPYLCAEALERLSEESSRTDQSFLFSYLVRLSSRERQAFKQWILPENLDSVSGKTLASLLYRRLAELRLQLPSSDSATVSPISDLDLQNTAVYLHEIWPDDPSQNRIAWFYRDILPLYACLREEERRLRQRAMDPKTKRQLSWIWQFKTGRIIAKADRPKPDQGLRYRLYQTSELHGHHLYQTFAASPQTKEDSQGLLFY